jgi:hypothetical protein
MGSNVAKIIKGLNVEDHLATTPTGPWKITYIRACSWFSAANTGLLVRTILLSNGVWDQVYPYRHVAVLNISLGERGYEPVLMRPRRVSPIGTLTRHSCQGNLSPHKLPPTRPLSGFSQILLVLSSLVINLRFIELISYQGNHYLTTIS